MKQKSRGLYSAVALLVAASACSKSNPARPTSTDAAADTATVTNASAGATMTTPQPLTPTDGQKFTFGQQPLTLTLKSAITTGRSALTYAFEVSPDSSFATMAYSKDGVADAGGQVALKIDRLPADKVYFWRARASSGGAAGPFTKTRSVTVGPEVILQAPVLINPANGGTANGSAPMLVVSNAARSGPAGQILYRFELSDASSFANPIAVNTVQEQSGQTSTQVTTKLTSNATYFWRVQASDPSNAVTGSFSQASSFRYVPFDMRNATIHNSPLDMGSWGEGAAITRIDFTPGAILVDFDRREGPNRWPDVTPPGWSGALQYTLGMCLDINDHWHCSAVVEFWHGRDLGQSAPPSEIAREWFYDLGRWGAMAGYQPSDGEVVGIFVCEGDCRNNTEGNSSPLKERSNVALVPFSYGGASYTYSLNGLLRTGGRR